MSRKSSRASSYCSFVYTGLIKMISRETFETQISKSPYLTDYAIPVSWAIPILELLAVALLVVRKLRLTGLYLSFALMLLFTEYIAAMLKYSDYLPCSCGGIISKMNWTTHLYFNSVIVIAQIPAIFIERKIRKYILSNPLPPVADELLNT
ncbi:MauE/DoxX family redox-associated membrane protein [Puia sp. P3]|uniref:MauE/DoxX family redox-associated membrane protein n=1 Tax=Puia sp. P3 TaxID=3423952 RepID=UPI003D668C47